MSPLPAPRTRAEPRPAAPPPARSGETASPPPLHHSHGAASSAATSTTPTAPRPPSTTSHLTHAASPPPPRHDRGADRSPAATPTPTCTADRPTPPRRPATALAAALLLLAACPEPSPPSAVPLRASHAFPPMPGSAPTATPLPPSAALPDRTGAWEARGLYPSDAVSLWALQTMACASEGASWRCSIRAELHTRDRVRKVGEVTLRRTTTFGPGTACFTYEGVEARYEDWVRELPLHGKLVDLFERGGLDREGCAELLTTLPDHLSYRRGIVRWDERRTP